MSSFPAFSIDPTAIFLYGGGGHGKTLIDLVRSLGCYRLVTVVDDGLEPGSSVMGVPVLGGREALAELYARGVRLAVNGIGGIGHVERRLQAFETLAQAGFTCPALVHPGAWVEPSAVVEGGAQVLFRAYVGSLSTVGAGSVLNVGAVVSHDCRLGKCVNLSPGALLAGGVTVEDFAQIGVGANVNVNLTIGCGSRVGNGATVKADVPAGWAVRAGTTFPPVHTQEPYRIDPDYMEEKHS